MPALVQLTRLAALALVLFGAGCLSDWRRTRSCCLENMVLNGAIQTGVVSGTGDTLYEVRTTIVGNVWDGRVGWGAASELPCDDDRCDAGTERAAARELVTEEQAGEAGRRAE